MDTSRIIKAALHLLVGSDAPRVTQRPPRLESPRNPFGWSDEYIASPKFLRTDAWRRTRWEVMEAMRERFGHLFCENCQVRQRHGVVMNVDHKIPRRMRPDLCLDKGNLQVLCDACNHGKGNRMADYRR